MAILRPTPTKKPLHCEGAFPTPLPQLRSQTMEANQLQRVLDNLKYCRYEFNLISTTTALPEVAANLEAAITILERHILEGHIAETEDIAA